MYRLLSLVLLLAVLGGGFLCINLSRAQELVNINTAGIEELDSLPGIGPAKAQAIIDYRQVNGLFQSKEDVMEVSGIGPVTYQDIQHLITLGGVQDDSQLEKIVINEILPNPEGSDETEWVELKNIDEMAVNLDGFQIQDNAKSYTLTSDDLGELNLSPGEFLVLEKDITKIALNNSGGDNLVLTNPDGAVVDSVNYSQTAKEGYSLARDEAGSYRWSDSPTKGIQNEFSQEDGTPGVGSGSSPTEGEANYIKREKIIPSKQSQSGYMGDIYFNELMPNPFGVDSVAGEWLELCNTSTRRVDLGGWRFEDGQEGVVIRDFKIDQKSCSVFELKNKSIILNNYSHQEIGLIDGNGFEVDRVSYNKSKQEGWSYNRCPDHNDWMWLASSSPAMLNYCPPVNEKPQAYFEIEPEPSVDEFVLLDAVESMDSDGEIVEYRWGFGRQVWSLGEVDKKFVFNEPAFEIKFLKPGKYSLSLEVVDNLGGSDVMKREVEVVFNRENIIDYSGLRINEILPNPEGPDAEEEWIELYNNSQQDLNLDGFVLDDGEGGSDPFTFFGYTIQAQEHLIILRVESGLTLNNTADSVRLFDPEGKLVDEVSYSGANQGFAYARVDDSEWQWLPYISPGEDNVYYDNSNIPIKNGEYVTDVPLQDLIYEPTGVLVRVTGFVTAEPGLLGKTIFYLGERGAGVQVYSYKKDFPLLALGDKVEVRGVLSDYNSEKRVKIAVSDDILKMDEVNKIEPISLQLEDIGEMHEGALIKVSGEVTEIRGSSLWVDDRTAELKVYLKQNSQIKRDLFEVGNRYSMIGILSQWAGEYRLLPRYVEDVKLLTQVKGDSAKSDNVEINGTQKSVQDNQVYKYLLALAVSVIMILVSVIVRIKR